MSIGLLLLLLASGATCALYWRAHAWHPYDPAWLTQLAQKQHPEESWLPAALERCTLAKGRGRYLYFVSAARPNLPGSAWQFERNITLEHPGYTLICLDVLKGHIIGGIELISNKE